MRWLLPVVVLAVGPACSKTPPPDAPAAPTFRRDLQDWCSVLRAQQAAGVPSGGLERATALAWAGPDKSPEMLRLLVTLMRSQQPDRWPVVAEAVRNAGLQFDCPEWRALLAHGPAARREPGAANPPPPPDRSGNIVP